MGNDILARKVREMEKELDRLKRMAEVPSEEPEAPIPLRTHAFTKVGTNPDYEERLEEFTHYYHRALRIPKSSLDSYETGFMYGTKENPECYQKRFEQYGPRVPVSEAQLRFIRRMVEEKGSTR